MHARAQLGIFSRLVCIHTIIFCFRVLSYAVLWCQKTYIIIVHSAYAYKKSFINSMRTTEISLFHFDARIIIIIIIIINFHFSSSLPPLPPVDVRAYGLLNVVEYKFILSVAYQEDIISCGIQHEHVNELRASKKPTVFFESVFIFFSPLIVTRFVSCVFFLSAAFFSCACEQTCWHFENEEKMYGFRFSGIRRCFYFEMISPLRLN